LTLSCLIDYQTAKNQTLPALKFNYHNEVLD